MATKYVITTRNIVKLASEINRKYFAFWVEMAVMSKFSSTENAVVITLNSLYGLFALSHVRRQWLFRLIVNIISGGKTECIISAG